MTPLLETKTPSAPVGDKSGGERRAARSLLSCALWRGMGGMVRPEPLSAHRPHQQQGLSGFHETRDPRHETRLLPGARRKPARIPRFSRNTRHETRITAFLPSRQTAHARRRQTRRLQGGRYEAVRKRVERGLSESRDKNNDFYRIPTRFTTRYIPQYPTMRRIDSDKPLPPIKRPLALRQPEPRLHGCIKSPRNLPWPTGLAKWRDEGRTGHESQNAAFDPARGASQPEFRGFHETRNTRHGFFSNHGLFSPWVRQGGATGNRRPDHCARRQAAVFQFTVVHYCSPLFR